MEITKNAFMKRINRKLAAEGECLKMARGSRERDSLGLYYLLDDRNLVTARHVDPEKLGREMGVLRKGETVSGK